MGLLDWLFGNQDENTTTTVENKLPAWYENYLKALSGRAAEIEGAPYQPYSGPRVAQQSADTGAAYDLTRAGIGGYSPYLQQAAGSITAGSQPGLDQGVFDSYMSPYTEGVVNRIADLGARNLNEKLLPGVNTTFTGAGQYGSTRHGDFTNRAIRDTQDAVLGAQAGALESAHNQAMNAYGAGQGRALEGGRLMSGIGELSQSLGLTDAAALESIGRSQEGRTQQNLDTAYGDFREQRDYPWNQLNQAAGVIYGQPTSQTQTTTGANPNYTSPASQIAGLGLGIFGAGKAFGMFKRGGAVKGGRKPQGRSGIAARSAGRRQGKTRKDGSPRETKPMAGIGGMGGSMMLGG